MSAGRLFKARGGKKNRGFVVNVEGERFVPLSRWGFEGKALRPARL